MPSVKRFHTLSTKGQGVKTIVSTIITLIIIVLAVTLIWNFSQAANGPSHEFIKTRVTSCRGIDSTLLDFEEDVDRDGLPNTCDNCPLIPNDPLSTKNKRYPAFPDNDEDLFPLGCCGNTGPDRYQPYIDDPSLALPTRNDIDSGDYTCDDMETLAHDDPEQNGFEEHPPYTVTFK